MSILQSKEKIKHFLESKEILNWIEVIIVLLVGIGAFFLGRASVVLNTSNMQSKRGVTIENNSLSGSSVNAFSTNKATYPKKISWALVMV
jgi:hypothetical protein